MFFRISLSIILILLGGCSHTQITIDKADIANSYERGVQPSQETLDKTVWRLTARYLETNRIDSLVDQETVGSNDIIQFVNAPFKPLITFVKNKAVRLGLLDVQKDKPKDIHFSLARNKFDRGQKLSPTKDLSDVFFCRMVDNSAHEMICKVTCAQNSNPPEYRIYNLAKTL